MVGTIVYTNILSGKGRWHAQRGVIWTIGREMHNLNFDRGDRDIPFNKDFVVTEHQTSFSTEPQFLSSGELKLALSLTQPIRLTDPKNLFTSNPSGFTGRFLIRGEGWDQLVTVKDGMVVSL